MRGSHISAGFLHNENAFAHQCLRKRHSLNEFADICGTNCKLSYKITDDYTLSDADVEEICDDYSYVDFDVSTISDIAVITVQLTAKGNGEQSTQTVKLMMTKESGKWKLFTMSVSYY